jgi:exocyst complex component 4
VIKASVQVLALITNLCAMLRTTPFHRENYSRLIISIIIQFYQRCSGHFTDVVSRHSSSGGADGATSHLSLSGLWAQRVELTACMEELNRTSEDKPGRLRELGLQETRLELALKNEQVIEEDKLLASTRKFGQLGNLYMSLVGFRCLSLFFRSSLTD